MNVTKHQTSKASWWDKNYLHTYHFVCFWTCSNVFQFGENMIFFVGIKSCGALLVIFLSPLSNQPICRRSAHIALNLFLLQAWWSICICWIVGFAQIISIIVLKTPTTILHSLDIEERPMINLHMLRNMSILSNHMQKPPVPTNNIQ